MSRRTRTVGGRSWLAAAVGSAGVHGLALLVIAPVLAGGSASRLPDEPGGPTWIDVVPPPPDAEPPVAPPTAQLPPARLDDAPEGDADHDPLRPEAPRDGDTRVRRAPAPDAGQQQGTRAANAWRRDRSTLRERLTDGAALYQPSRRRTSSSGRASSPQAVRRELLTGMGDEVRSSPETRAASEPARTELETPSVAAGDAVPAQAGDEAPRQVEPVTARPELPHPTAVATARHGVGALDSDRGPRSFDHQTPGRAADDRDQRAASDELHPGITDLSRPGVPAPVETAQGRGPAAVVPGVVAHPSSGTAPGRFGAPAAAQAGPEVDGRTQDRRYQRYIQEIARRVNSFREFPRGLALRLEQGETVVRFVLGTDGRISDGVKILKSSGFDEFDAAATRAVERAAPFPPMPATDWARPLPVSVRVAFENPLVR